MLDKPSNIKRDLCLRIKTTKRGDQNNCLSLKKCHLQALKLFQNILFDRPIANKKSKDCYKYDTKVFT